MKQFLLILLFLLSYSNNSSALEQKCIKQMQDDIVLGNHDAPVTVIEYSSMSCPICAYLHNEIIEELEKAYIKPGKVKFILRPYPIYPYDVKAAALAFCAGPDKYYLFLKVLFETQKNWLYESRNTVETLEHIGKLGGLSGEKIRKCFENKRLEDRILESREIAQNEANITSTPKIIINGKIYNGGISKKSLINAIDSALKEV